MEFIIVIVVIVLARMALSALFSTAGAAAKAAVGKGSFSDNMELAFVGMKPLEVQIRDDRLGDDGTGPLIKVIEAKGLFPVKSKTQVGFVASVFDNSSGEFEPVISLLDSFQEPDNVIFQHLVPVGAVGADEGYVKWSRVGAVIPEALQPPSSGSREMAVLLRLIDLDNPPTITHGFHDPEGKILGTWSFSFQHHYTEKGYQEAEEHRDEATAIAVKIGMAIAMSDGSLAEAEGDVLRTWVSRAIEPFSGEKREVLKGLYNDAMRSAYSQSSNHDLPLGPLVERLKEIGDSKSKYDAIELCFDVMAADGVADSQEMGTIRKLAEGLDLDIDEIAAMRDQKIVGLSSDVSSQASVEDLLGIGSDWEPERIRSHLRTEFQKWNDRLSALPEGTERDNAQQMLDLIADARKKYTP
jgi:tellurite resistance protein